MKAENENLVSELLEEITRVQEMITEYKSLPKNAGLLAATMMQRDIIDAKCYLSDGDVIGIIKSLKLLKEYGN